MNHRLVTSSLDWASAVSWCRERGPVAVDLETTGLRPFGDDQIIGISIGVEGMAWYCPVNHVVSGRWTNVPDALAIVAPLLTDPSVVKVFHNADFDCRFLLAAGIEVVNIDCTLVLAAVSDCRRLSPLYPKGAYTGQGGALALDRLGYELCGAGKGVAEEELALWCREHGPALLGITESRKIHGFRRAKDKWKTALRWAPLDLVAAYACMDADLPLRILKKLSPPPMVYTTLERPLIPVLIRMEAVPKYLDLHYIDEMEERTTLWEQAAVDACAPVNPHSSKQLIEALFAKEGAFLPVGQFTAKGAPSTDAQTLTKLRTKHPLPAMVLEAKVARKLRTTYLKALRKAADDAGLIHPLYLQWTTATGRLSSRGPNFQNIPRGPFIRNAVVAPEGFLRCHIDYAQIEPRLMAHFGRDRALLTGFARDEDVYGVMACRIFPELRTENPGEIKAKFPALRSVAKVAVLAVCYGAQARKLKAIIESQAGISYHEGYCRGLVFRIRRAFPKVFETATAFGRHVNEKGAIVTPYGHVRPLGWKTGGARGKEAFNTLIQGTAAGVMKNAILRVDKLLRGSSIQMDMTVHDELGFIVPVDEKAAIKEVVHEMERDWPFRVPMKAEATFGPSWGQQE